MRDAEIMKCAPAPMLSLSRRRRSTPTMTVARALLPLALFALVALCAASVAERPWMNTALPPAQRAQLMLQQMTLDEQLFMLYGHPSDYTGCIPGLPRLGRPNLFFNDGPQGVNRGANGTYTAWPSTMSMSSTWDVDLIKHWGTLMGEEFFLKGFVFSISSYIVLTLFSDYLFHMYSVNVALSPGANFARYPGNGRLFEYIASEDPFLGQSLVQPLVSGIQSQNGT
jgi:beta-glucosidase